MNARRSDWLNTANVHQYAINLSPINDQLGLGTLNIYFL
jgi:hypothetical protein